MEGLLIDLFREHIGTIRDEAIGHVAFPVLDRQRVNQINNG